MADTSTLPKTADAIWEDDYTEIHLEDATYGDFDWDNLDRERVDRHDTILEMRTDELESLDTASLDDFLRWAAARAWLGHDHPERFISLTQRILDTATSRRSNLLSYPDITLSLSRALAAGGDLDRAMAQLELYRQQDGADLAEHARHRGLLLLEAGDPDEGLRVLIDAINRFQDTEPELGLQLSEDLLDLDHKTQARAVLEAARNVASSDEHRELRQEIEDTLTAYFS